MEGLGGVELGGSVECLISKFCLFIGKLFVIEHIFEYNRSMELGDFTAAERDQRSLMDNPRSFRFSTYRCDQHRGNRRT